MGNAGQFGDGESAEPAGCELFPDAQWQRCVVPFYRNVFSHVPNGKVDDVAHMLKAIHAQEDRRSAEAKIW